MLSVSTAIAGIRVPFGVRTLSTGIALCIAVVHIVLFARLPPENDDVTAVNYEALFTKRSAARKPSAIRALQPLISLPGMISLGGGMPNPSTFPFASIDVKLKSGESLALSQAEVNEALQYSPTPGLPALIKRLKAMQKGIHRPPGAAAGFDVAVTTGSQDGLAKAFEMLVDAGDSLLVENPTYSGSLAALEPIGCNLVNVPTDKDGLVPEELDAILTNWDEEKQGKRPKVLYTIPIGCNPTGASLSLERRKKLYEIARKPANNLLILEDDPYYFLQYNSPRLPSLFSMDVDGRVLRFDSFSKVFSSGIRIGFVTGPPPLVNRINLHSQSSNLHVSGVSQVLVQALFRHWGVGDSDVNETAALGHLKGHVDFVVSFYRTQCDAFVAAADKHLKGLVEYSRPTAGMFVWMKLLGVDDSFALIREKAVAEKVLMVPGSSFIAGSPPTPYVRASFSTASPAEIDTALSRLAKLLRSK